MCVPLLPTLYLNAELSCLSTILTLTEERLELIHNASEQMNGMCRVRWLFYRSCEVVDDGS